MQADVEALILNDGSEWRPDIDLYHECQRLYPAVDIAGEFVKMRRWCIGNPKKRKTKAGIKRFVTSWLSREQDSPHPTSTWRKASTGGEDPLETWYHTDYGSEKETAK